MKSRYDSFIRAVESTLELADRYQNLRCKSITSNGKRKGVLSIVFKADDTVENRPVAIKFLDPHLLVDLYRLAAFQREPEIIKKLQHRNRCLRLELGHSFFTWELQDTTGAIVNVLQIPFFCMEWLDDGVDDTFMNQSTITTLEKLTVFRLIVLALTTVHSEDISHRDIKADNMRFCNRKGNNIISIIDFGTAASFECASLGIGYAEPVGAGAYSAPEAFVGFANERRAGKLTDIYALGCLLYQLFNNQLYMSALHDENPNYNQVLLMLRMDIESLGTYEEKFEKWSYSFPKYGLGLQPAPFISRDHSIPLSVQKILSSLHCDLVNLDFRSRLCDLSGVLKRTDNAICVLKNNRADEIERQRRDRFRKNKLLKLARLDERLKLIRGTPILADQNA